MCPSPSCSWFLLHDAYMHSASLLWQRVRLLHASIVSKRIKISTWTFFTAMVFEHRIIVAKFLTGKGAWHSGGLRNFWSDNAEQWHTVHLCGCRYVFSLGIRYGGMAANRLPILFSFSPSYDIALRRVSHSSWAACITARCWFVGSDDLLCTSCSSNAPFVTNTTFILSSNKI